VFRILDENVLCSIATVSAKARAHINTAYFCHSDNLDVYFLSHPHAAHCRNLLRQPWIAAAVFSSRQTWGGSDRGVQLFGTCREPHDRRVAERLYSRRFVRYAKWRHELESEQAARDYRFYWFQVRRVTILDELEFGDAVFVRATVQRPH
jgi:uncharacterized protein YhbP (UPF0306 family)